jgi:hypothetical protein
MSLQTNLASFATRVGTEMKGLREGQMASTLALLTTVSAYLRMQAMQMKSGSN